jgi:hypothetical protein
MNVTQELLFNAIYLDMSKNERRNLDGVIIWKVLSKYEMHLSRNILEMKKEEKYFILEFIKIRSIWSKFFFPS